jgi:uncharacterized protein
MAKLQRKFQIKEGVIGSAITVRITPRSSKNEIIGIMDDGTIKIRITAAPVDGKANEELIGFLSKVLQVSETSIQIIAGQTNKNKLISILHLGGNEVNARILDHLKTG